MQIVRQGDVLLVKVDEAPASEGKAVPRKQGSIVVAEGEATGHMHSIAEPDVTMYERGNIRWLVAPDEFVLEHQEHDPLVLDPGIWRVVYQREYSPEAIRRVLD